MNIVDVQTAVCGGVLSAAVCESLTSVLYGVSDSYLRITGPVNPASNRVYTPQIVVRCMGSLAVAGVYRRLLKRCIVTLSRCCSRDGEDSNHHYSRSCNVVVVPGGGVNELLFSSLWLQIATQLGMSSRYAYSAELTSACIPLATRISKYIDQVLNCYNFAYKHSVVNVLAFFAEAYLSIPRQLLDSMDGKNRVSMLHQWMLWGYRNRRVHGYVYSDVNTSAIIRYFVTIVPCFSDSCSALVSRNRSIYVKSGYHFGDIYVSGVICPAVNFLQGTVVLYVY